jgi:hypothetical protein
LSSSSTFTHPSAWHDNIVAASSLWSQILGYVETSGEAYILTAERVRTRPIFIAIPIQWYNIRFYILVLFSATASRFLAHLRPSQALLIFLRHSFPPSLLLICSGYIEQLSEGGCQSCCPLSKPSISNASSLGRHRVRPRGLLDRLDQRRHTWPDAHSLPDECQPVDRNTGSFHHDVRWPALDDRPLRTPPSTCF